MDLHIDRAAFGRECIAPGSARASVLRRAATAHGVAAAATLLPKFQGSFGPVVLGEASPESVSSDVLVLHGLAEPLRFREPRAHDVVASRISQAGARR